MLLFRHAKTTVGYWEQYKVEGKENIKNKQNVTNIFVSVQQKY